jgi:hypothetical protein
MWNWDEHLKIWVFFEEGIDSVTWKEKKSLNHIDYACIEVFPCDQ